MSTKSYQYILSFFFYLAVLGALTACGGGGGGGGGGGNNTTENSCDVTTHLCGPDNQIVTGQACLASNAIATNNIYDCDDGTLTCDNSEIFCHATQKIVRADCKLFSHLCRTTGEERTDYDITALNYDTTIDGYELNADGTNKGYKPSIYERPPGLDTDADRDGADWNTALTAARTAEYGKGGGADKIGAAYAHARGATGDGVIISQLGNGLFQTLATSDNLNLITGYRARVDHGNPTVIIPEADRGFCTGDASACRPSAGATHAAGIMVAPKSDDGNGPLQGIAYDAVLKPIDIYHDSLVVELQYYTDPADAETFGLQRGGNERVAAIREGTKRDFAACGMSSYPDVDACEPVTVMNNVWGFADPADLTNNSSYTNGANTATYKKSVEDFATISDDERIAWREAVKTTVVVFPAGDNHQNTVNGLANFAVELSTGDLVALRGAGTTWSNVDTYTTGEEARNLAALRARLPKEVTDLQGKWLSVVALDSGNKTIHARSNGCGDAMAWCLAAPGENITSIKVTDGSNHYGTLGTSATDQAAAHVSAAVAVVKSAFSHLTPAELVTIILETADDLGDEGIDGVYGYGRLNLAKATEPIGRLNIVSALTTPIEAGVSIDNSGITLPTSFGNSLNGFTVGFIDDYNRAYVGAPTRITQASASFTLGDTIATWESPELQNIALDSNSKMQFTNYEEDANAKDTLIFTHNLPNHTIGFSYNEESKTPDLNLANTGDEMHFQKIRPIASDLMQVNSTHKLGKKLTVKNAITSGEFDTGNRFNEAMANLNYAGDNRKLTIGAGTLQEYGQFLGASGTGAYQLSDATRSQVTHLAITQNLPRNSSVKVKYTNFKTEVDMRYDNFANINDLTANEYQLSFGKKQVLGKSDSLNLELIQPFAVTDGKLQQSTILGYNAEGGYNNVTQNYDLKPANRRQQIRMTWQNQLNLERKTKLFISMQYENHVNNLRDNEDSQILGGISTKF